VGIERIETPKAPFGLTERKGTGQRDTCAASLRLLTMSRPAEVMLASAPGLPPSFGLG
jgi:hypothetical protein